MAHAGARRYGPAVNARAALAGPQSRDTVSEAAQVAPAERTLLLIDR